MFDDNSDDTLRSPSPSSSSSTSSLLLDCPASSDASIYETCGEIQHAMEQLLQCSQLADVTFLVGPQEEAITAHKSIICSRCEYFRRMLSGGSFVEAQSPHIIRKPDTEPKIFQQVLRFLYSGRVTLSAEDIVPTILVAVEFGLNDLVKLTVDCVRKRLSVESACLLFDTIGDMMRSMDFSAEIMMHLQKAHKLCFAFVCNNVASCFETEDNMFALSQESMLELVQADELNIGETELFVHLLSWTRHRGNGHGSDQHHEKSLHSRKPKRRRLKREHNIEQSSSTANDHTDVEDAETPLRQILEPFWNHIRFAAMPPQFISTVVEPCKLVPTEILYDAFKYHATRDIATTRFDSSHILPRKPLRTLKLQQGSLVSKGEGWQIRRRYIQNILVKMDKLQEEDFIESEPFEFGGFRFVLRMYLRRRNSFELYIRLVDPLPKMVSKMTVDVNLTLIHPYLEHENIFEKMR